MGRLQNKNPVLRIHQNNITPVANYLQSMLHFPLTENAAAWYRLSLYKTKATRKVLKSKGFY